MKDIDRLYRWRNMSWQVGWMLLLDSDLSTYIPIFCHTQNLCKIVKCGVHILEANRKYSSQAIAFCKMMPSTISLSIYPSTHPHT